MDEQKLQNEIRNLIARNKTERAFELLSSIQFSKTDKELIILNSQYNRIQEELRLNVISKEEGERRINQINLALLDVSSRIDSTKSTIAYQADSVIKKSLSPKLLWLLLLPVAALLLYWGLEKEPDKTETAATTIPDTTYSEPPIIEDADENATIAETAIVDPPKPTHLPIVPDKTYSIINTLPGKWKGASISWDKKDPHPMVSLEKDDPVEWRFDPVPGKADTYKIVNTNKSDGGKWVGASISWDTQKPHPMVSLEKDDPVEWQLAPVAGKENTYKIINTNKSDGGKWVGASISWDKKDPHPMVSLEKDDPVEWQIIAKE